MSYPSEDGLRRAGRRIPFLLLTVIVLLVASVSLTGAFAPTGLVSDSFLFKAGTSHFWEGPFYKHATVYDDSKCGIHGHCPEYTLEVMEPASRLRVGLYVTFKDADYVREWADHLDFSNEIYSTNSIFNLQLYDPNGTLYVDTKHEPEGGYSRDTVTTDYGYTRETFVENPAVGTWTVRVVPVLVRNHGFKMRAKLETEPAPPGKESVLNPNLRMIPPFEVNFRTPTHTYGPSFPNDGTMPSCMSEEWQEADEHGDPMTGHCLRFSAGVENVGEGPLLVMATCNDYPYLRHPECKEATEPLPEDTVQMYQRRLKELADGTTECCVEEEVGSAGYAEYHDFHGHFHYEDVYVYDLYEIQVSEDKCAVGGSKPLMEQVGTSEKRGFWPWDEHMAEWDKFYQVRQDANLPDATLHIGSGWGDAYEYNRGGNFIPFPVTNSGTPESGCYLVRATADVQNKLIESNEDDNISYTMIQVGGTASTNVRIVERGYGNDPWDSNKKIITAMP